MLHYNDLKPGVFFIFGSQPHEVLESNQLKMQQRRPVLQTKIRNLISGKVIEHNFQQSDTIEEAAIERRPVIYLYEHRGIFWFSDISDKANRFNLTSKSIGSDSAFLRPNSELEVILFDNNVISVKMPVKVELRVKEAPPAIKGNTAQGGTKTVVLETGATIQVPLFINSGDIIRINTQERKYVERVEKN